MLLTHLFREVAEGCSSQGSCARNARREEFVLTTQQPFVVVAIGHIAENGAKVGESDENRYRAVRQFRPRPLNHRARVELVAYRRLSSGGMNAYAN
jgi:hypothetical protein